MKGKRDIEETNKFKDHFISMSKYCKFSKLQKTTHGNCNRKPNQNSID